MIASRFSPLARMAVSTFCSCLVLLLLGPARAYCLEEIEPNDSIAQAQAVDLLNAVKIRGNVFPNADVDYFAFQGEAGDRVYSAVATSFSASNSSDSQLRILASDGVTEIEFDDDSGSMGSLSSSIAGAVLPAAGQYYLEVKHSSATSQLRPYFLYAVLQRTGAVFETESNDSTGTANALLDAGYVAGTLSGGADLDIFSLNLNAGDTVFASLDLDPERDNTETSGRLGFFAAPALVLVINDAGSAGPDSEALFFTAKDAGTHYLYVDVPVGGLTFSTYHLKVSVIPGDSLSSCTQFTNASAAAIADGGETVSSLNVSGAPRIGKLLVHLELTHANMPDLDVSLISPAGAEVVLFSDIGSGGLPDLDLTLDDEAAFPLSLFTFQENLVVQPELNSRLSWFDGVEPNGDWTLKIYDDTAAATGNLISWGLTICPSETPPTCGVGLLETTVFSNDFESGEAGFTHSGTADEWELGLPVFAPIDSCNSGSNCWKTDLDNTYSNSSSQELLSPAIDLTGLSAPITVSWAHAFNMESASFDSYFVDVQDSTNPATFERIFQFLDATMQQTVGTGVVVQERAGWATLTRDISSFAGSSVQIKYALTSDTTVNLTGVAIDNVAVKACTPDSDGDGVADSSDGCPNDASKAVPGTCGCGIPETDSDSDGTLDCIDSCPADSAKTSPGACGCGIPDADSDGDGTLNCLDSCPADVAKTSPGACGCGVADTDSNGNSITDCLASQDLNAQLTEISNLLNRIKPARTKKAQKKLKQNSAAIKSKLSSMLSFVSSYGGAISVPSGASLSSLVDAVDSSVRKALKTKSSKFKSNKSKAKKAIAALKAVL